MLNLDKHFHFNLENQAEQNSKPELGKPKLLKYGVIYTLSPFHKRLYIKQTGALIQRLKIKLKLDFM